MQMEFEYNDKKYFVGSDMFPVSDPEQIESFKSDNTEPFWNEEFCKIIDVNTFDAGHCYSNAEKIRLIAERFQLPVKYYSGWLFARTSIPTHHAWAVIDNKHLIDMGYSERSIKFLQKVYSFPDWRERFADNVAYRKSNIRHSKDCIMGKVLDGFIYVGSIDEMEAARKRFRDMRDIYPDHFSYSRRGQNMYGASAVQEEIFKRQMESI
jgi:hypothetical protein